MRRQVAHGGRAIPGLYERRTGDGRVVYEVRRKVGGKAVRRALAAQTPTDAIREAKAWEVERDSGVRLVGRDSITLRELRDQWAAWSEGPSSKYAPRTRELYLDRLDRHVLPLLGEHTKAATVKPSHIRALIEQLNEQGFSGSTVRGVVTVASALFKLAVHRDHLETNPCRLLEHGDRPSAKRTQERRYLSRPEIDRLLAELPDDFRPVAAVCAFAGLRISEALWLRWSDVNFDEQTLRPPGTKTAASKRPVRMPAPLAEELRAQQRRTPGVGDALVFRMPQTGEPPHRKTVLSAIYEAGDRAGLNQPGQQRVGCHSLRHTFAGLLLDAGMAYPKVAEAMRHADTRTLLEVYAGVVEAHREDVLGEIEAALS
jgi:integrase